MISELLPEREAKSKYACHAINCEKEVDPKNFMCPKHWAMVPTELQTEIWNSYLPGQGEDVIPSKKWMVAAVMAIKYILDTEKEKA